MSCNWPIVKLGDYCSKIGSGATPKGGNSVYLDNGEISLIRSQNIYNDGFKSDGLAYITPEAAQKLKNVIIEPNDVLINITGDSVARVCLAPNEFLPARVNQHVAILRVVPEEFEHRYLRYYLTSTKMQNYLLTIASTGGTRNALTKLMLESLAVSKPPLNVQKKIGDVLEQFENKILINTKTNQTLEQMAQAIFKSWFVDFDPVKAKMNGEQPEGMDAATASLFPEKLVESELGLIPEGWEASTLESLVDIASSKRIFAKEYLEEGVPFFRGKEITELSKGNSVTAEIYISEERYQELKDKSGAPKEGDILITSVGTIGNTYLVDSDDKFYFKDGNLTWVRGYKDVELPYFLMEWFKSNVGKYAIENIKIGSTQQAITIKSLNGIKLVNPSSEIHERFTQLIEPLYQKHRANIKQSKALANLRDTLLPKLLSGEIELGQSVEVPEWVRIYSTNWRSN